MSEVSDEKAAGCGVAVISIFLVLPMWFTLVYSILVAIDATAWQWGLFYGYIVSAMANAVLTHAIRIAKAK